MQLFPISCRQIHRKRKKKKYMNKTILTIAAALTLAATTPATAQRHRHTPRTTAVANSSNDKTTAGNAVHDADEVVAYSDTTMSADSSSAQSASNADQYDDSDRYNPSRFSDPFSWFAFLCSSSFMGVLITIFIVAIMLLFLFMPIIIVFIIIRYIIRRHNDRVRLAEKAMEQGCQLSDEQMPLSRKSPEYMWRRGVRNVSMGLGLMLLFWFLNANPLVGIGGLIACLGAGQMFMVRYNYDHSFGKRKKDDGFDVFDDDIKECDFSKHDEQR